MNDWLKGFVAGCLILFVVPVMAQDEEDKCTLPTNKKIVKLLQQAHNDKYKPKEQYQFIKDALEMDEDCAECKYQLGVRSFQNANQRGSSYDYAEGYFTQLIQQCPKYHSDAYYYLGVINFSNKNRAEALKYFREFLDFKGGGENSYSEDFPKKKKDVMEILPEIEFDEEFFSKPVPFDPYRVQKISTDNDEYLPMLSPDNQIIFFTRTVDRAMKGDIKSNIQEEFSMAYRDDITQPFDAGTALPKPFNVGPNYGGSTISIDNKEIIVCACIVDKPKSPNPYKNCDLYSARYERFLNEKLNRYEYRWSELVNLGPGINTPDGWEAQPSLSSDGNMLFYATNRYGSRNTDIYVSVRGKDGKWGPGKDAGPIINSDGNDKTPFLHTDSKTLYFASETGPGRLGAGGFDIFYTRMDENGKWTQPKNIGYPINTDKDEVGLIVSSDGKLAYFASNSVAGARGWDVFAFELHPEARPERIVIVKGDLKDSKGITVKDARVEIKYASTGEVGLATVDTTEGKFVAAVKAGKEDEVLVTVKKEGHSFSSKLVEVSEKSAPMVKNVELEVAPIEKGKSYTINDILFGTASYELNGKSKFVIDQFIDFLKENKNVRVEIQGHTDNEGDPGRNLTLSENRAKAVMNYIIMKGIAKDRLTSKGYGQTKPKVPNTSDQNKAKNRRTEFFILDI